MINTIILSLTAFVTAITPIMLAIINRRQAKEAQAKADRLEELHAEVVQTIVNKP